MKAFVSDFDGTIFFPEREEKISRNDVYAIKELKKENLFGICTGRPLVGLDSLFDVGIECDFYILTNGALILDRNCNPLLKATFKKEDIISLIELIKPYEFVFQTTEDLIALKKNAMFPVPQKLVGDITPYLDQVIGISIATPSEEIAKKLSEEISKQYDLSAFPNQFYVDIIDKKCSKGNAVNFIRNHFSLEKVFAIGDSYNDLSMLNAADVSFTFQESSEDVKRVADHVVKSLSEAVDQFNGK